MVSFTAPLITCQSGLGQGLELVFERPTCFIRCSVCCHTPGARLAAFGYHDGKFIHGVWFKASDCVAQCCGVCRLDTKKQNLG